MVEVIERFLLSVAVIGCLALCGSIGLMIAADGKQSPGLYELRDGQVLHAADYNILVEHITELERKVQGMQKQITILHAKKADK